MGIRCSSRHDRTVTKKEPNKKWALEVLGTINPDHEFFTRDYKIQPKVDDLVDNWDGLYDLGNLNI